MSLADQRKEYSRASLTEQEVHADPMVQFGKWFDEAQHAQIPEANCMSLATVNAEGRPACRIVLIKDFDARGPSWYTNYASRKGEELLHNPQAALLFHWIELERQIRIEGRVERLSDEENDAYFRIRPLGSRIGAIASHQSQAIANRAALEAQYLAAELAAGTDPHRPPAWGGYRLIPDYLEFWQGRPSRLHDRIAYRLGSDGRWQHGRLQP